jgi:hypothetical protein
LKNGVFTGVGATEAAGEELIGDMELEVEKAD